MILPEERAQLARIKEGYRDWLERARHESDQRRAASHRRGPDGDTRAGDPRTAREPLHGGAR